MTLAVAAAMLIAGVVPPEDTTGLVPVTEVTPVPLAAIVIEPEALVIVTPVPAVNVVRVNPVPLPISSAPFAGVVVSPVPPLATATVPVTLAALPPRDRLEAVPVRPVPAPVNDVALKTPVLGTKLNLVDAVFCGRLPVVVVTQVGYTDVAVVVSSVIAVFVAFVAVVAVVAVLAFPVNAPTKVVDVTEVKPTNVVTVAPSATAVEPIVTLEFVSAELGIEVKAAPEPLNPVAVKTPVEGLN